MWLDEALEIYDISSRESNRMLQDLMLCYKYSLIQSFINIHLSFHRENVTECYRNTCISFDLLLFAMKNNASLLDTGSNTNDKLSVIALSHIVTDMVCCDKKNTQDMAIVVPTLREYILQIGFMYLIFDPTGDLTYRFGFNSYLDIYQSLSFILSFILKEDMYV